MGKKPIVSVTYENEKCVLRLSCVVHRPIYGRVMGFYVNGLPRLGTPAKRLD